ncbi:MAG: hypothetical protein EOO21_00165 [Comamonadaceae bacterium]|nr:MAG: hypothetical protein EOO21_00165 [Comamonadaceae bacterium]
MSPPRPAAAALVHTSFYKFTPLAQPEQVGALLRDMVSGPEAGGITGSILVAPEGINGMLAGSPEAVERIEQLLLHAPAFDGAFSPMAFKHSACTTAPFGRMKVQVRKEIVPLGVDGVDARATGVQVSPADWGDLIRQPDVVLLDNRNSFEYRLGRFEGAIDPQVTNFRDFPAYVRAHAATWKAEGKRVAMYCTGGIRCEKASAWMLALGLPTYQLEGGILNYFAQAPDAGRDWQGECYVFDNRVALDARLQETATTYDDVYAEERDAWRLQRARRLAAAGDA